MRYRFDMNRKYFKLKAYSILMPAAKLWWTFCDLVCN